MRIGSSTTRVAGIGAVMTDKPDRKTGLARQTALRCLDGLADHGYQASMLFGIRDFYEKLGYVKAWHDSAWSISTEDVPAIAGRIGLRRSGQGRPS